ncbi:hypothetical protein [Rhizohabitans arisaemae]|uniref:hypothetical protein n=1 Tax=Rhizohabitans arisaemae TaxID=2720610 RepID=UPI0024B17572|nr:hypothetical protein [Rhizohabitans arisaemae]
MLINPVARLRARLAVSSGLTLLIPLITISAAKAEPTATTPEASISTPFIGSQHSIGKILDLRGEITFQTGSRPVQRSSEKARFSHSSAAQKLRNSGIRWMSSGRCSDHRRRRCTSFHEIRHRTLAGLIRLKRRSDCPVLVTGGTEVGHAPGPFSHMNGYKVDISLNRCVNRFIRSRFPFIGRRGDGAALYHDAKSSSVYAREPNHWDILFR